jgi:ankyrin repeat protein
LLERGAEVERSSISEDEEGTALQFAAIAGSIVIVNELIQRGANVNAAPLGENGRTALEGAAEHGRLDMVQLLLNLEAEVQGSRALQFARKEGHDGVAMLLLQNGFEDDVRMSG